MNAPTPETAKIQSLEGLRGLMAWWVLCGHVALTFGWRVPLLPHNTLAVDVFVILSGFVIARLIDRKHEPYTPYIVRRGFRIVPLYLVVLVASLLLLPIQGEAWSGLSAIWPTPSNLYRVELVEAARSNLTPHLIAHLALAQGAIPGAVLPHAPYTILGQAWSISLEMQFYLLAPLVLVSLRRPARLAALLVALVVITALSTRGFSAGFIGSKWEWFGVGIVSYLGMDRKIARPVALAMAAGCAVVAMWRSGAEQLIPLAIWAVVLASAMAPAHSAGHVIARVLAWRPLVYLGQISYSLYLVHMIPLAVSAAICLRLGAAPALIPAIVLTVTAVASLLIAMATYHWVELPGIRAGSRFGSARSRAYA